MNSIKSDNSPKGEKSTRSNVSSKQITLEELIGEFKKTAKKVTTDEDRQATSEQITKERETIRIGQEKYYDLRDKWSRFIAVFIGFMLLFQLFITVAIGYNWVNFSHHTTFLHLVIGENFAQILGMGYIVAKYLFPQGKE